MTKTFVNILTTSRFLCSFFLPWIYQNTSHVVFLGMIVLLFLTDTLDGFLARRCKVQSFYGALMDTIADKVLNIILLVILLPKCPILWSVLLGEILIFSINGFALWRGKQTRASIFGKTKMWLVAFSVIFGYLYQFDICDMSWVYSGTIIAFVSQMITMIDYLKTLQVQKKVNMPKVDWQTFWFNTDFYLKNKI